GGEGPRTGVFDRNGDGFPDGIACLSIKPWRSDPNPPREEGSLANPDSFNVFIRLGTSFACPHVAGAIALLRSMGLTNEASIEHALKATALHFRNGTGRDPEYGFGLIQVGAAVRYAVGRRRQDPTDKPLSLRFTSPNPASGSATIEYRTTRPGPVFARVYDARGALVRRVYVEPSALEVRTLRWDGLDDRGVRA